MLGSTLEMYLFTSLGVGVGGILLGLVGLLFNPRRGWTIAGLVFAVLLGALAAGGPFFLGLARENVLVLALLASLVGLFVVVRCGWLIRGTGWLLRLGQQPRLQGLGLMIACGLFLAGWIFAMDQQVPLANEANLAGEGASGNLTFHEVLTVQAVTDLGRPVALRTRDNAGITDEALQRSEQKTLQAFQSSLKQIRTGDPDLRCNCHGWVFTDGNFWVLGHDVPQILEDNGYQAVNEPHLGDLIVYRDDNQMVVHTGIVRLVGPDGLVLIESKWGTLGRFIHRPADQAYGTHFTFYHSERPTHRLRGLSGDTVPTPTVAD